MFVKNGIADLEAQYAADTLTAANAYSLVWWLDHRELSHRQMADYFISWSGARIGDFNTVSSKNLKDDAS
jgi:hypothetical protein